MLPGAKTPGLDSSRLWQQGHGHTETVLQRQQLARPLRCPAQLTVRASGSVLCLLLTVQKLSGPAYPMAAMDSTREARKGGPRSSSSGRTTWRRGCSWTTWSLVVGQQAVSQPNPTLY